MRDKHNDDDIYLISGKELNQCIWAVEQIMELFVNNDEMLQRMGRLRDRLENKLSYLETLDKLGLTDEAPTDEDISFTEFLDGFGLKPHSRRGGKNDQSSS
tara:strand:- start:287 stop:589 length:303 start_codon:yes stop_codon:yes gene_type:complete